ncbi:hypothetical protein GGS20DRAFT_568232 [Poronia punctata]|nr:hypothetical protein GGS20DRAFT_568232 [Poronia punctata]
MTYTTQAQCKSLPINMERGRGSGGGLSYAPSHDVHVSMQEYLALQAQYEELCQRLRPLDSSYSRNSTSTTSAMPLLATAPSPLPHQRFARGADRSQPDATDSPFWDQRTASHMQTSYRGRSPVTNRLNGTAFQDPTNGQVAADEEMLFNVNEGLKHALTELLNCQSVRQDGYKRTWVQSRLMETEKELRRSRRRRSSGSPGTADYL